MSPPATPSAYEAPKSPTYGLPQLRTYTAETEDDRIDGLHLIADSVAQQRQVASKMLIFHPFNVALYFLVIAVLAQYMWKTRSDLLLLGTTVGGVTMAALVLVRLAVGGYLSHAEDINMEWLGDDRVLVVTWGEEIIGSLVLGWADNSEGAKKRGTRRRRGKAVVRGWTVRLKYRGKGVGEGLLEEAVKVAGERGADGIIFDRDHASKFTFHDTGFLYSDNMQTRSASSPASTTATSTSKKPAPKRPSKKWPTRKATSANDARHLPGAADNTSLHFLRFYGGWSGLV